VSDRRVLHVLFWALSLGTDILRLPLTLAYSATATVTGIPEALTEQQQLSLRIYSNMLSLARR